MVFNYIQSLNLDCNFISSINESTFIEKINTNDGKHGGVFPSPKKLKPGGAVG